MTTLLTYLTDAPPVLWLALAFALYYGGLSLNDSIREWEQRHQPRGFEPKMRGHHFRDTKEMTRDED